MKRLTDLQEKFAVAISTGMSQYAAYKSTYDCSRQKEATIYNNAYHSMKNPAIVARINQLRDNQAEAAGFGAAEIVARLKQIATADPNELTSYQRVNCRHCHGTNHKFQWRDDDEYMTEVARIMSKNAGLLPDQQMTLPSDKGGYGYRNGGDPVPACPKCQGEGIERLYIGDTRHLSKNARPLYAGVKKTKDGIEVKTHDQMKALELLAKHFRVIGPDNATTINVNATATATVIPEQVVPFDPKDAAKFYQKIMKGHVTK